MFDLVFIFICNILYVTKSRGCLPFITDFTNKRSILSRYKIQISDLNYMIQCLCGPFRFHISLNRSFFVCRYLIDLFSKTLYKCPKSSYAEFISENRKNEIEILTDFSRIHIWMDFTNQ